MYFKHIENVVKAQFARHIPWPVCTFQTHFNCAWIQIWLHIIFDCTRAEYSQITNLWTSTCSPHSVMLTVGRLLNAFGFPGLPRVRCKVSRFFAFIRRKLLRRRQRMMSPIKVLILGTHLRDWNWGNLRWIYTEVSDIIRNNYFVSNFYNHVFILFFVRFVVIY